METTIKNIEISTVKDVLTVINILIKEKKFPKTLLEEQSGISYGLISRWQNNSMQKSGPKLNILLNILKNLEAHFCYKLDKDDSMQKIENVDDFLSAIDSIRKYNDITIRVLEEKAQISSGIISRWNRLKSSPSLDTFINIFKVLDTQLYISYVSSTDKNSIVDSSFPISKHRMMLIKSLEDSPDYLKLFFELEDEFYKLMFNIISSK